MATATGLIHFAGGNGMEANGLTFAAMDGAITIIDSCDGAAERCARALMC
jgi:hypothetical protein